MKTILLIAFGIIFALGFVGTTFATHDPNQPYTHSIILPLDMKEKTFEEFMEWCTPHYGEKCMELYANSHLIPEPSYSENIDEGKPCGLGTTYQDGICVVNQTENVNSNSSYRWENPYNSPPIAFDEPSHPIPNPNPDARIHGTIILSIVLSGIIGCFVGLFVIWRKRK